MILIVTSRDDLTADYVILELRRQGITFFRLNTDDIPSTYSLTWAPLVDTQGTIVAGGKAPLPLRSITSVWYRRPVWPRIHALEEESRYIENEWKAVLENLWASLQDVLWISRPDRIREASNKIAQLRLARALGFNTPDTIVSNDPDELRSFHDLHGGNVVGKVLHAQTPSATGGGYLIYTTRIAKEELVPGLMAAPLLLQEYVEKAYEIRSTVVGDKVFSVAIDSQSVPEAKTDWRRAALSLVHEPITLSVDLNKRLVGMVRQYGLAFGAFDLVQTPEGDTVFLELNPNGQWAWLQQLTGIPIREALIDRLAEGRIH